MEVMVFPVGQTVLYPSFSKPFHIIDPQHIMMIHDALATHTAVAVASVFEPQKVHEYRFGEALAFAHQIVGFGYPRIVDQQADGSIVVFIEGAGKAILGKAINKGTPYIICHAEPIVENEVIHAERMGEFLVAQKMMVHWLTTHIADAHSRDQFLSFIRTPQQVIGCYASYLLADSDLQQLILEIDDINEKISLIGRLIQSGELVA